MECNEAVVHMGIMAFQKFASGAMGLYGIIVILAPPAMREQEQDDSMIRMVLAKLRGEYTKNLN